MNNTATRTRKEDGAQTTRRSSSVSANRASKRTEYYAAYGSNLSLDRMFARCPDAQEIGTCILHGYQLVFKGVADIIPTKGSSVPIGVYRISASDERALDRYEGWTPDNRSGMYRKEYFSANMSDSSEPVQVMFYAMNRGTISVPGSHYYNIIAEGYADWDMPMDTLQAALRAAQDAEREYTRIRSSTLRERLRSACAVDLSASEWDRFYTDDVDACSSDDPFSERKLTCRANSTK